MQLAKRWHVCGSHGKRNCHKVLVLVNIREIVKVEPQTVLGKRLEECKLKVTLYRKNYCSQREAGMSRKRWWRRHADHQSRCFSRKAVPACKTPWRNFCQSRRKIHLSRREELSRAGSTKLVNVREVLCHDEIVQM